MFKSIRNEMPAKKKVATRKYPKSRDLGIWRFFHNTHPEYLARHYWWAYLWRAGIWFFDHQPVINATLFGNYRTLSLKALNSCMANRPEGRFLQLTCVYGNLMPSLLKIMDDELYLVDVSNKQLILARSKLDEADRNRLFAARMNVEQLAYCDNAFASILMFFLLHELPHIALEQTLSEIIRVLRPGGRLVIADYSPRPVHHLLWKLRLARTLLLRLEPFLEDFLDRDLTSTLSSYACKYGKQLRLVEELPCFRGFYRVCTFELGNINESQ